MNTPSENNPSKLAKNRLTEACRTKDTSVRLAWAITICEAVLVAALALALIDYWLMLPVLWRTGGALFLAGLAALGAFRLFRFYRRPTRLKEAALDVEAQRPELGCEISTAAEYLAGERKITKEYEPELVAALQAKAAQNLSRTEVPYKRRILPPAVVLAVTFLGFLILVILAPAALTALQRTALPFSNAHYTEVAVRPGNIDVPVGSNVEITNVFTGRTPADPQLHLQESGTENWQRVALKKSSAGDYVHSLKKVESDLSYRVTGNDAASEEYKITTYVPPAVKELQVEIGYPEYTRKKPATQKSPDISAVRASTVKIDIQPSTELSKAKLRFSNLPEVSLERSADGSWMASLKITKDTDYWIELADKKGHVGVNEKPYHIKALPDNAPKVEITEPAKDLRASATNTIPVKISVTDDFGVGDIKLVFHKLGGSEQTVTAKRESEQNGEVTASSELELSPLGLNEYELVAFHAEASDNNTLDGPGIGKSPVYFIEITNKEGGQCLSQCQNPKVNLLVIQKQIIADTTALAAKAEGEKFADLAGRQHDAKELANIYLGAVAGAPAEVINEMEAAIKDMEKAKGSLDNQSRTEALPPEEGALAHLYQVLKLMPELQNLPTPPQEKKPQNPKLNVVLEEIKKKKQQQPDNKEIEDALQEAKNLARAQSGVNAAFRAQGDAEGEGQGQQPGQSGNKGESKNPGKGKGSKEKGKGQGQGQGDGEGQGQGQGQGDPGEKPGDPSEQPAGNSEPQTPAQLAEKESQLSKEAAALAEKLQRLSGKDTRVGHNAGNNASKASSKMEAAGKEAKKGGFGAAGIHGFQGELALRKVVAQLEQILKGQPEASDIANEDYPKEYEGLISEYLKKLSHAD